MLCIPGEGRTGRFLRGLRRMFKRRGSGARADASPDPKSSSTSELLDADRHARRKSVLFIIMYSLKWSSTEHRLVFRKEFWFTMSLEQTDGKSLISLQVFILFSSPFMTPRPRNEWRHFVIYSVIYLRDEDDRKLYNRMIQIHSI